MSFITEIIGWYRQNKRDLPWRNTSDPYIIWLSEIILQQTRVEQGMPYFHRFAERFPTVSDFAGANEEEILKLWQGLGYYSRGRNMHHTAQLVMEQHAGYFPRKYDELIKLKGVGEYTAAAISSFSSNEAKAVVDGNVFRLLSRYFGIHEPINSSKAKKIFTDLANELIDKDQPGLSNQALMEFGSLQCRPKNPLCESCVLRLSCEAFMKGLTATLPKKLKKQPAKNRFFNYVIAAKNNQILFNKRGPNDIWQNLYEFPLIESEKALTSLELLRSSEFQKLFGKNAIVRYEYGPVKHVLSHQRIQAKYIFIENFKDYYSEQKAWFYTDIEELDKFPSPKIIFAFLKNFHTLFT
ncbi:A/G-specific adenine glycosylase [Desertivirga xinjiangensis]|uniref:A/G-specific adenine glycosylase n=1 Tax=Desertivirga xinjiangensis TaxID=539206 RepID=UPI002108827E|nr:A/G-specific adenine glycosylase [Pedobacter xinjiangensis]